MKRSVLYVVLTCVSSQVVSQQKNLQERLASVDPRYSAKHSYDFYQEPKIFQDEVIETNAKGTFEQLLKSLSSDSALKTLFDLFLQDLDRSPILKVFNNRLIVDEIWKGLQDFLVADENQSQSKDKGETEHQQKTLPKDIKYQKNLQSINTNNESLYSPQGRLLRKEVIESVNNDEQPPLNHRIPRKNNARDRHTQESIKDTNQPFQEFLLNLTSQVARHGYKAKEYSVRTKDGYVLGLHRIWTGKSKTGGKRPPVLLMHGLLLNSACWLGAGPSTGLAYLLAEAGYDVWLGNARGNYYSRAHVFLNPDSKPYWQFCADEIAKYDLPAIIDEVLKETGAEKLNYVGFSQGGGTYFLMCSELPHYCMKSNIIISLAPSGRHLHTKSPVFRLMCEFCRKNEKALLDAGVYEALPKNGILQKFLNFFCRRSNLALQFCELFKDLLDSPHPGSFSRESIYNFVSNFPSGTSVHNMARYGQSLRSRAIYKFDYGTEKNLELYGSSKPALYNLSIVSVPVVVIYGRNDGIVDIDDIKWLIRKLPNVIEAFEVEDSLWSHMDVAYSQYVPTLLYPKVVEYLNKF